MKKIIFVFTILFSFGANTAFVDGNELYKWLESEEKIKNLALGKERVSNVEDEDYFNFNQLLGFIQATADINNKIYFCLPDNVTIKQIGDITYGYLKINPEVRHEPAVALLSAAMMVDFPCKSTKK